MKNIISDGIYFFSQIRDLVKEDLDNKSIANREKIKDALRGGFRAIVLVHNSSIYEIDTIVLSFNNDEITKEEAHKRVGDILSNPLSEQNDEIPKSNEYYESMSLLMDYPEYDSIDCELNQEWIANMARDHKDYARIQYIFDDLLHFENKSELVRKIIQRRLDHLKALNMLK